MSDHRFLQIIRALLIISKQVHSCETKLNTLLEKSGEDAQLLKLTEQLKEGTDALQAALETQEMTRKKPQPKKEPSQQ